MEFSHYMMKNRGFSLTELIIVIVVLAILSVIAVPKLLSVNSEASAAVVNQTSAGIKQLVDNIYAKAIIQNKVKTSNAPISINGITINSYFGAPQEIWNNKLEHFMDGDFSYVGNGYFDLGSGGVRSHRCAEPLCVIDQTPGSYVDSNIQGWGLFVFPKGYTLLDKCYAFYAFSENGYTVTYKEINGITDGC